MEKAMLTALTLCWIVQVARLVIRIKIGLGQSITNSAYVVYLFLVMDMILGRIFLLFIVPFGTPDGESPALAS